MSTTKTQRETYRKNRAKYRNMGAAETIRNMSNKELNRNARRGGRDAILEQARRQQWARGDTDFGMHIMPDPELDIGV